MIISWFLFSLLVDMLLPILGNLGPILPFLLLLLLPFGLPLLSLTVMGSAACNIIFIIFCLSFDHLFHSDHFISVSWRTREWCVWNAEWWVSDHDLVLRSLESLFRFHHCLMPLSSLLSLPPHPVVGLWFYDWLSYGVDQVKVLIT